MFVLILAVGLLLAGVSPALADSGCAAESQEVTANTPACDPTPAASDNPAMATGADAPGAMQAEAVATNAPITTLDSNGDPIPFVEEVTAPAPAPALLFSDEDLADATQP